MELYFGCRYRLHDFLYGNELSRASEAGVVSGLHTAFSREQEQKIYVTHRMMENKNKIWETLGQSGGVCYICGSAAGLGTSVKSTLVDIAVEVAGMSRDQAQLWLETMRQFGRLKEDLYSVL